MKCQFNFWQLCGKSKVENKTSIWSPLLCLSSFATTIGTAVPVGYFLGVMNTNAKFIKQWSHEVVLSRYNVDLNDGALEVLWSSMVSIFLVGGILGSFIGAWCANKYGRKGSILISAFLLILSGFLLNFCRVANSLEMLFAGRLISGIAAALIYTSHPMYLMEIAPIELRDTLGVFCAAGVTAGIVVGQVFSLEQVFGTNEDWPYALSFYTLIVVVCFLPCHWFPESPRWLYVIRRNEKAASTELYRLRGFGAKERVSKELTEMEMSIKGKEAEEGLNKQDDSSFLSVVKNPTLLLPLLIVCSFQLSQQLSGINAIFYYSVDIFEKAGFSTTMAAWMNLGAGVLNMIMSLCGPILMSKFNRRPMMMISCFFVGASLLGMSFALNYIDHAKWISMLCVFFTAAFIFFFQFGLGPIPYFIASELFEVSPRPVAMSLGSLVSWTGNLIIGMIFPVLRQFLGAFAFIPCSIVCVYCFLLTWRYLPESRNHTPTELKLKMANGFKSKVK